MSVASDLILLIDQEFQELRKEYTLFFNDVSNLEPLEKRDALLLKVKRLRNMTNLRTEEDFRANNLIGKVQTHLQLWDRQTETKYVGNPQLRARRKAMQQAQTAKTAQENQNAGAKSEEQATPSAGAKAAAQAQAQRAANEPKRFQISDALTQREKVVELYDEYMRLNQQLGQQKVANFAKFQTFIQDQTSKLRESKRVSSVQYEVAIQDQKVVIKSKTG